MARELVHPTSSQLSISKVHVFT